jgi:signal transduction histidine kinase
VILHDITERKQAEQVLQQSEAEMRLQAQQLASQLVQSEKLSSLGQLVAGIAHEINNPVGFIYGNLSHAEQYTLDLLDLLNLYQQHYPNPVPEIQRKSQEVDLEFLAEDLPKLIDSMQLGAERIQRIVMSLQNFSRKDEAEIKFVDIHEGIESTLMILHQRLKFQAHRSEIQVIKQYGKLPPVECYVGQLNQVIMNIVVNAIDSIDEKAELETLEFIPAIRIQTQWLDQDWIRILISDNGIGISEAVGQRLFDPFFTTKPVGKGTGLGLSLSHDIITQKHGGRLVWESGAGAGALFKIEIPCHQQVYATSE